METSITVSTKGARRIDAGHPWVFSSDIIDPPQLTGGEVVSVYRQNRQFLGRGYFNARSQISLRMLTHQDIPIDRAFWQERIRRAVEYRRALGRLDCCRLIHAESDFLPALIVDKFADVLVVQALSAGIERVKADIVSILLEQLPDVKCVYERSDAPVRRLEGLEQVKGPLYGNLTGDAEVLENGVKLLIDVANGQKTGYFLDQHENRAAIAPYVRNKTVLDCFCHIGSFALHAAHYGAADALGIDVSEEAVSRARMLADYNGFSACRYEAANAFDALRQMQNDGTHFDTVILDPPAFAKDKHAMKNATRGYKEINLRGIKLVREGGTLVTCSCSQHMTPPLFLDMLRDAAADAHRQLRIIEVRGQAKDHPSLLAAPETNYLKCVIAQVWD
ncbi:MAG: class I SAM-dependent rRNA methyltransferase [Eubacteriales bacterium]|nr:class I SAM-dependent rRNA methyltransferase [Eubacteriales bacterium]